MHEHDTPVEIHCEDWKRLPDGQWSPLPTTIMSREDFAESQLLPGAVRVVGPSKSSALEHACSRP